MRAKTENPDQFGEVDAGTVRGEREPDVLFDGAPCQQAGLLKHHAETAGSRGAKFAAKIGVEAGRDLQDRGLAAAGRADQRAERSGLEPKIEAAHDLDRRAVGRKVALGVDAKLKQGGAASGLRVVQAVARQGLR